MRLLLSIVISALMLGGVASAQTDQIGLYTDTAYDNCKLVDSSPGVVSVYVVHNSMMGATGSQFILNSSSGAALSYVGEVVEYPTVIGNTQSGISIGYTSCAYSDILVATVSYYTSGASSPCSSIYVAPDPASLNGYIEIINCSASRSQGAGSILVINANDACDCGPTSRDSNWGRIKDFYD